MVDAETLDMMSQIEAFVSDNLQVVSYKWLSRKFSVSSNEAKRLLKEFVETHEDGLEVIYTLSGWLKDSSTSYHIKLVSAPKLSDARKEFEDNCSVQVYSVQACIPKDPAALWNAEFVQSEELFNQPSNVDNCLWDNRYCGVSNSFVKRNASRSSVGITPQQAKTSAATMSSRTKAVVQAPTAPQPLHTKVLQVTPKSEQMSAVVAADINNGKNAMGVNAQAGKPNINKEKDIAVPGSKKKVQGEKSLSVSGGSIANLWGRASTKAEPACAPLNTNEVPNTIATAANLVNKGKGAQSDAHKAPESVSSDDDDGQNVKYKRTSNGESGRKRRVVFDLSDEEDGFENAVNLASPDPPKENSNLFSKENSKALVLENKSLNFEEQKGDQLKIKQEKKTEREASLPQKDSVNASKSKISGISILKKTDGPTSVDRVDEKAKANDATSTSPKRRKVVKTRIDERGREVNEVVWEGEELETKKNDKASITTTADNRPPPTKKSPSLGSNVPSNAASKAGAKKTGKGVVKDAKQGNILSFFKRA